jgi:hypothetical protein
MSFYVMPPLPLSMAAGLKKTPNFDGTVKQKSVGGITSAMSTKPYPTWDFEFSLDNVQGQESEASSVLAEFMGTFMGTSGGANLFLFEDPQDSFVTAAQFGVGNGTTVAFQLSRNINGSVDVIQNLNGSPSIFVNGVLNTSNSISSTGVVTFSSAPGSGAVLTWTGNFYFLCRFSEDTVDATRSYTINSGIDQWNVQSIKFSSEFLTTTSYGTISAAGGAGGGGGFGGGGFGGGGILIPVWTNPTASQTISTFPLVLPLLDSSSANIAATGFISLANTDTIVWRNAANSADLPLGVNTSNQLTFNGSVVGGGSSGLSGMTAGQVPLAATASTITSSFALGTGVQTFLTTPTSANLATAITNETGSGALVFGTSPTFTTSILMTGATTAGHYLRNNGTAYVDAAISAGDVPTLNQSTTGNAATATTASGLTSATTTVSVSGATAPTNGQVLTATSSTTATWQNPSSGFSNPMTTLGDIMYENSTPAAARLAGNTTSTKNFLVQTGTGSVSAAPSWGTISAGDVPTLNQNTTGSSASCTGNAATATNISTNGTANQVWGMNSGATAQGWQTVSGGGSPAFSAITTGTNTTATMTVGSGASIVTTGTGNVVACNGRAFTNVKVEGAVGNGSTNDSTAIQSAFTAAGSTTPGVYFPSTSSSSNYLCTTAITDPSTGDLQFIRGEGGLSFLETTGTNNLMTLTHVTDNVALSGFEVSNVGFSGNGNTPTSIGSQVLLSVKNANSNSSGGDVTGLMLNNCQFNYSQGAGVTVNGSSTSVGAILNHVKNCSWFDCAEGIVFTGDGTTCTCSSTYMNTILGAGYVYNNIQGIAHVGTAMDTCGIGVDLNSSTGFSFVGCDSEASQPWQQSITTIAATTTTITVTVANTYVAGQLVYINGGTSTNAPLNGWWKIATTIGTSPNFTGFTVTWVGTAVTSNSPSGMKSCVYAGQQLNLRNSSICGAINGMQMYTPTDAFSPFMLVDATSGLVCVTGYTQNSGGVTNDIVAATGCAPLLFKSSNFGASTQAAAIYSFDNALNGNVGDINYTMEGCTFGVGSIAPTILYNVHMGGNPAPTTAGVLIDNGTAFANAIDMLAITQRNSGDTGNCIHIQNSGTSSNDILATNWSATQAGLVSAKNVKLTGSTATTAGELGVQSSGASNPTIGDGTNARNIPQVLYKAMNGTATGNVTSYTSLFTSPTYSSGSLTLVANALVVGSMIRIKAQGTCTVGVAGTLGFEILLGGTVVWVGTLTSTATTINAWTMEGDIYCSATGASGTAAFRSMMEVFLYEDNTYSTALPCGVIAGFLQSTTTGIATTGTNAVDLRMEFGSSNASNTAQLQVGTVELL